MTNGRKYFNCKIYFVCITQKHQPPPWNRLSGELHGSEVFANGKWRPSSLRSWVESRTCWKPLEMVFQYGQKFKPELLLVPFILSSPFLSRNIWNKWMENFQLFLTFFQGWPFSWTFTSSLASSHTIPTPLWHSLVIPWRIWHQPAHQGYLSGLCVQLLDVPWVVSTSDVSFHVSH